MRRDYTGFRSSCQTHSHAWPTPLAAPARAIAVRPDLRTPPESHLPVPGVPHTRHEVPVPAQLHFCNHCRKACRDDHLSRIGLAFYPLEGCNRMGVTQHYCCPKGPFLNGVWKRSSTPPLRLAPRLGRCLCGAGGWEKQKNFDLPALEPKWQRGAQSGARRSHDGSKRVRCNKLINMQI